MADLHVSQTRGAPASTGASSTAKIGTMANWAGAAVSLALVIGVGVWGYKLLVRDVSGVPVVRAAEGPMRIQPEDPGGQLAENMGFAVNDVAAVGTAADPADRLILAPKPLDLRAEDAPQAELAPVVAPAPEPEIEPETQPMAEADEVAPVNETDPQLASIQALADQLAAGVAPLGEVAPVTARAPEPKPQEIENVTEVAATVPGGLGRSLRPQGRPATLGVQKTVAVAPTGGVLDIDPASLPAGTRLAQLGAYDSADVAKREWDRLSKQFSEYLDGKSRVIQKAQSGGRTFYRLRAHGFADLSDARRFCSALVAEKAECIPVVTR